MTKYVASGMAEKVTEISPFTSVVAVTVPILVVGTWYHPAVVPVPDPVRSYTGNQRVPAGKLVGFPPGRVLGR